jgi:hypothetical protein
MAKTQTQQLYDDLNELIDRYPNMRASRFMLTMQAFMNGVWHAMPRVKPGDRRKQLIRDRKFRYRLG